MDENELVGLLKAQFGKVKKANGGWWMIPCPTCSPKDMRKMKRGVNFDRMSTKCFICGEKLYVRDLLGKEVRRDPNSPPAEEEPEHPQARIIPCQDAPIPINELPSNHPAIELFKKDYLTDFDKYAEENEIGWIPAHKAVDIVYPHDDRPDTSISPANSLVFPVRFNNELVGWQLRYIPGSPKFRYFHIFKKGDHLYNFDNAIGFKMVVVVEGVKKALKFPNAVATFGKSISEEQIQKLMNWDKIVFLYDGEDETQRLTRNLVEQMNVGSKKVSCIDPRKYGFDSPDEMPQDIAQKIIYVETKE